MAFSLAATQRDVVQQIDRLLKILADMPITSQSRYALAEIVLIRAASVFEGAIADLAYKVACGATFPDGSLDKVLVQSRSMSAARASMKTEGGNKQVSKDYLKWTRATYIADSVKGVLDHQAHYIETCRRFGSDIAEIFEVRNYAAHKNNSSRKNYLKWVKIQYGQERRIQLGYFLLTKNLSPIPNIERYLSTIRVILKDIVTGP